MSERLWVRVKRDVSVGSIRPMNSRTFRRNEVVQMYRVDDAWWSELDVDGALILSADDAVVTRPQPLGPCWHCSSPIWPHPTFGYAHSPSRDGRVSCCNGRHRADPGPLVGA